MINQEVVIVPVGGNILPNSITAQQVQTELNKIYKQAIVNWTVTLDNSLNTLQPSEWDDNANNLLDCQVSDYFAYTAEMNNLIDKFNEKSVVDDEKLYLFLVFGDEAQEKNGIMPFGKQFGFIMVGGTKNQTLQQLTRTMAHELGHGAFGLMHPWQEFNGVPAQGTTQNLMDYSTGTKLRRYQWYYIHNPRWHFGGGDEDETSLLANNKGIFIEPAPDKKKVYCSVNKKYNVLTPAGKVIQIQGPITLFYSSEWSYKRNYPKGVVTGFLTKDGRTFRALYQNNNNAYAPEYFRTYIETTSIKEEDLIIRFGFSKDGKLKFVRRIDGCYETPKVEYYLEGLIIKSRNKDIELRGNYKSYYYSNKPNYPVNVKVFGDDFNYYFVYDKDYFPNNKDKTYTGQGMIMKDYPAIKLTGNEYLDMKNVLAKTGFTKQFSTYLTPAGKPIEIDDEHLPFFNGGDDHIPVGCLSGFILNRETYSILGNDIYLGFLKLIRIDKKFLGYYNLSKYLDLYDPDKNDKKEDFKLAKELIFGNIWNKPGIKNGYYNDITVGYLDKTVKTNFKADELDDINSDKKMNNPYRGAGSISSIAVPKFITDYDMPEILSNGIQNIDKYLDAVHPLVGSYIELAQYLTKEVDLFKEFCFAFSLDFDAMAQIGVSHEGGIVVYKGKISLYRTKSTAYGLPSVGGMQKLTIFWEPIDKFEGQARDFNIDVGKVTLSFIQYWDIDKKEYKSGGIAAGFGVSIGIVDFIPLTNLLKTLFSISYEKGKTKVYFNENYWPDDYTITNFDQKLWYLQISSTTEKPNIEALKETYRMNFRLYQHENDRSYKVVLETAYPTEQQAIKYKEKFAKQLNLKNEDIFVTQLTGCNFIETIN